MANTEHTADIHAADRTVTGKDFAELCALEESLWRADTRFDAAKMDTVFAADFFEFGRSGRVYARDEMLFERGSHGGIDAVLPLPDFQARYLSDDIVQVTYVSDVGYDGNRERANRSSIWSRDDEGWVLRFHQGTAI